MTASHPPRRRSDLLHGVVPPLVTPLTPDGALDTASLSRMLDHVFTAGCTGAFVLGTSGEGASFTHDQRTTVIAETVDRTAGRGPVLAGVLAPTTRQVIELCGPATDAGADAVVVAAPFYNQTNPAELDQYFRAVAAATDVPVIAYDIPSKVAGTTLPAELLIELASDRVIAGVKDSTGSISSLRTLIMERSRAGVEVPIMTGSETTVDLAIELGADGCIPGLANVDPAGFVRLLELVRAGSSAETTAEQERLIRLMAITSVPGPDRMGQTSAGIGGFKTALTLRGVLASATTAPPFLPLDDVETEIIRGHLAEAGLAP